VDGELLPVADRVEQAQRAAHREAAPAALLAAVLDVALGLGSSSQGWTLYGGGGWWVWLVLAIPAFVLSVVFFLGLGRLGVSSEHRRVVALGLLAAVAVANLVGIALVIVSLLTRGEQVTGGQLLASALVVLVVNVITFALVFWEVDCGGPVLRSLADKRVTPDFQFPQDENPELGPSGWSPTLGDYGYLALTNSVAFSPTDAMPLSHRAKLFMSIESVIALSTLLVVAARAVNILHSPGG
jgi:hypothetical protein